MQTLPLRLASMYDELIDFGAFMEQPPVWDGVGRRHVRLLCVLRKGHFAGKSAIQWLPESWTARFLSAPFFGAQSPDMKGFLTPNFLADAAAKAAPSVVNISIHGNGSAVQVTLKYYGLAVACVLHLEGCGKWSSPAAKRLIFCGAGEKECMLSFLKGFNSLVLWTERTI